MTISSYAGPQMLFANWDISGLVTGFKRWYANQRLCQRGGGKLAADIGITSDWLIGRIGGGQSVTNRSIPAQSGPLFSLQSRPAMCCRPPACFSCRLATTGRMLQIGAYSYSGWWLGGGYSQDLPFGFSAGFSAQSITSPAMMMRWRGSA